MQRLTGRLQHSDWGDLEAIAEFEGREPSGRPEAELWLGAHPSGPATLADGRTLDKAIENDPTGTLGAETAERDGELPFLLKVLAAAKPLSIQAHPNAKQASEGFAKENEAGIALDAPTRIYRDMHHKPELICALTPFRALCGFRELDVTRDLFESLGRGVGEIRERLSVAGTDTEVLAATMRWLLADAPAAAVTSCVKACRTLEDPDWEAEAQVAIDAAAQHGDDDPGVVVALLLNNLELAPGEALYLGAGNLHAYLGGMGVEVMSNSDNVVRGGLTNKHVDVAELLDILDCAPLFPDIQHPDDWNHRYRSEAREFRLHRYELGSSRSITWDRDAPAVALVTEGTATFGDEEVERGGAVFLAATDRLSISGEAEVYLATTG